MTNAGLQIDKLKRHIDFNEGDVANLRSLNSALADSLDAVTEAFYRRLFADPQARLIFREGQAQITRQRNAFRQWLGELFCGRYDEDYFRGRVAIGRTHVRVSMPQQYMFTAFEIVRQELRRAMQIANVPDFDLKTSSLDKLLTLETTMMLESYKEHYASAIRVEERTVAEEKVTRSEHLAQLGQLAASLAHEIKNPLAGISGAIQVIRDGLSPDNPHRNVIREVLIQIGRLDDAVKDLLVYARPKPPELSPCILTAIVEHVLKMHRGVPALRDISVHVSAPADLPAVAADGDELEQLIINLLFNAGQASLKGGQIEISLQQVDRRVRLVVSDKGHGMDEETAERAFEPFFTTKAKGTGLGLPICRKIVEAHQGSISVVSNVNEGTRVTVELPMYAT